MPTSDTAESITAEAERLLNAAPDVIGSAPVEADPGGAPPVMTEDELRAEVPGLLELGTAIVDVKGAAAILRGLGKGLASVRDREAYAEAGERAAETCSDSLARVLNQAWAQLAPSFMKSLENNWPGMIPLCAGLGFAFGPAVVDDWRESRAAGARVGGVEPKPEPQPAKPGPVPVDRGAGLTGRRVGK